MCTASLWRAKPRLNIGIGDFHDDGYADVLSYSDSSAVYL
jgi:hypothetical protein